MASQELTAEIALAEEAVFTLGAFEVTPSLREIRCIDERVVVEPRVMQVLTLLAKARGRTVSRDELIDRCWGGRAVGEDALNRAISRVRKLASLDGEQSFTLETIPRVGYLLRDMPRVGSPAEEATSDSPAGTQPSARTDIEVDSITAVTRPDRRALLIALGVAGVAACGVGVAWLASPGLTRPRIAVLPFDTDQADQRVIADGLGDALIAALMTVTEIDVVARSSSFALRGARKADAAKLLGATHLIDGSVSRMGGIETATLDLIDAVAQTTLWSRQYPVTSATLSLLRTRVMRDTTTMMRQSATGHPIDPMSYRLMLQGRGLLIQDPPRPGDAIPILKRSLARVSDYAPGWTTLGNAYLMTQTKLDPDARRLEARASARDAAGRALRVDPDNAAASSLLAAATDRSGQWQTIERLLDRALQLEPSDSDTLYRAGIFFADVGWNNRAIELLQRAWDLDPLNADAAFLLLRVLQASGRGEDVEGFLSKVRGQWRDDLGIWRFAICRAVSLHHLDEARGLLAAAPVQAGTNVGYFADLLACMVDPHSPRLATFLAPLTGPLPPFWPISIFALAMIGDREACLSLIRRVFLSPAGRAQAPTWVLLQTMVRPLWNEPALRDVFREIGLFDFWRTRGGNPLPG